MPDISAPAPTGYLSDGEILAWVEEKSEQQYGDVRELMNASGQRGDVMKDLTTLKADIDEGASPDEIRNEMLDLESKYEGTPFAGELHELLGPMEAMLPENALTDDEANEMEQINTRLQTSQDDPDEEAEDQARLAELQKKAAPPNMQALKEPFDTKIQGEIDQLNRLDQVGLITIQADMNDAHQTAQLASSLVASSDQTKSGIISNFRG